MCNCDNRPNQDVAEITNLVIRSDKLEACEGDKGDNAYYYGFNSGLAETCPE